MLAMLAGLTLGAAGRATEGAIDMRHDTLWQLIDRLGDQPSLSPARIERVLPVKFAETYRNAYFSFHDAGRFDLAGPLHIDKVELRVSLTDAGRGLVTLRVGGACLPIEQVRARFADLVLSDVPRGRSLDEEASYATRRAWGKLSFGFKERNPRCLATVVIDRIPPLSGSE